MRVNFNPIISERNIVKTEKSPETNVFKTGKASYKGYCNNIPFYSFRGLASLKDIAGLNKVNKETKSKAEELKNNAREIQYRAKQIYNNFEIGNKRTDALNMFYIGKNNDYMSVKNTLNGNIYFNNISETQDSKIIKFREYKEGQLIRQATLENDNILTIDEEENDEFKKYNFTNGNLNQYSHGTKKQGEYIEDEYFAFNPKNKDKLSRYSKCIRKTDEGTFKESQRYEFDKHGKLSSYKQDIERTASDKIIKIGVEYCFKNGRLIYAKNNE